MTEVAERIHRLTSGAVLLTHAHTDHTRFAEQARPAAVADGQR